MTAVRRVTAADIPVWAEMRFRLWPEGTLEEHLAEAREFFAKDHFAAFIAEREGRGIGFAEVSIRPYANGCESRPVGFLEGVWVEEGERRRGAGRSLLAKIEEWVRSSGLRELGSDALLENRHSHAVHARWGFMETERVVYFRKALR